MVSCLLDLIGVEGMTGCHLKGGIGITARHIGPEFILINSNSNRQSFAHPLATQNLFVWNSLTTVAIFDSEVLRRMLLQLPISTCSGWWFSVGVPRKITR